MALKKVSPLPLILFLTLIILSFPQDNILAQEKQQIPEKWKKWINEFVVHIISDRERDLFFQLDSEEKRLAFEKEFWLERDPTPGTTRNEFFDEHQKRFDYANKYLGRDSSRKGWQTDRGRFYIILGEPRQIQRMPSAGQVYPLEIWFYQAEIDKGLPSFFNLIFYKRFGTGEYRLYSPVLDGPQSLFTTQQSISNSQAYENLYYLNPDLAQAAFSYTFDQTVSRGTVSPSLSSVTLIGKIENSRNVGIDPSYAERILLGTSSVTTNYTFSNFVFPNTIFPMLIKGGNSVINYSFEVPTKMMNMGKLDNLIYGALEIETTVSDPDGLQIQHKSHKVDFEYSEEEFEAKKYSPIVYEDQIMALPGLHSISIRIRNPLTRESFLIADNVFVPGPDQPEPTLGRLLLCSGTKKINDSSISAPFQFSDYKMFVQPDKAFPLGSTLFLYSQIILPQDFLSPEKKINVTLSLLDKDGKVINTMAQPLSSTRADKMGLLHLTVQFPVELTIGEYIQALEVDFGAGYEKQLRTFSFAIVDKLLPVNRRLGASLNLEGNILFKERGKMNARAGNLEKAKKLLLEAVKVVPADLDARISLGNVLMELNNYQEIINLLQLSLTESPDNVQILNLLGLASYHLGHYSKASKYLERFLLKVEDDVTVINALADSWLKLENAVKARKYWNQSLEIDPDQSDIRKKLEGLK